MVMVGMKSMTGDRLPGEYRILNVDGDSQTGSSSLLGFVRKRRIWGWGWGCEGSGGGGGGGGGVGMGLEAAQHQELSGETMVGGSSFRVVWLWVEYPVVESVAEEEMVVSRYLRRLGFVG